MKTLVFLLVILPGCGVPVWSQNNVKVSGKAETESTVNVNLETDADEVCSPLLPNREAYLACVRDYVEALSCIGKKDDDCFVEGAERNRTATGVN